MKVKTKKDISGKDQADYLRSEFRKIMNRLRPVYNIPAPEGLKVAKLLSPHEHLRFQKKSWKLVYVIKVNFDLGARDAAEIINTELETFPDKNAPLLIIPNYSINPMIWGIFKQD